MSEDDIYDGSEPLWKILGLEEEPPPARCRGCGALWDLFTDWVPCGHEGHEWYWLVCILCGTIESGVGPAFREYDESCEDRQAVCDE